MALPVKIQVTPELAGLRLTKDTLDITGDITIRYARAVIDENPKYLGKDKHNLIAPPMFGVVLANRILYSAVRDGTLPLSFERTVHGEHDMRFSSPIRPGDKLISEGQIRSVEKCSTGITIAIEVITTNHDGAERLGQVMTLFVRETNSIGTPRTYLNPDAEPVHVDTLKVPRDQTFRYAKASFTEGIKPHEDHEYARSIGYRTYFLAGQNTMAFAARAILDSIAESEPTRLRQLKARFAQVVYPCDNLTTRVWASEVPGTYTFATAKQDGTSVLVNGQAEVEM